MRKIIPALAFIILFIGFSSCEQGPVEITDIYLAKEDDRDFKEVDNFSSNDGPFYCIVDLSHAPQGTKIEAVWTAVDIPSQDLRDEEIDSYRERLDEGDTHLEFSLNLDGDWPEGKYNVEIFIDDESHESINFKVK